MNIDSQGRSEHDEAHAHLKQKLIALLLLFPSLQRRISRQVSFLALESLIAKSKWLWERIVLYTKKNMEK